MKTSPKVSICIPAYEYPELLKRCLLSVVSQTYNNFEIIITDDSKHNGLQDVVIEINDARITYIKNPSPLGSPGNWNESIRHASGDLIMTLHHDDWLIKDDAIATFAKAFTDNPLVSFAFCQHNICYSADKVIKHVPQNAFINKLNDTPHALLYLNEIGPPSVIMYTKEVSQQLFDVKSKWYVDVIFYVQAIAKFKHVYYIQEPLVNITAGSDKQVTNSTRGAIKVREAIYTFSKFGQLSAGKATPYLLRLNFIELFKRYKINSFAELQNMGFDKKIISKLKGAFYFSKASNTISMLCVFATCNFKV